MYMNKLHVPKKPPVDSLIAKAMSGMTYFLQETGHTCGAACLRMALSKFMSDVPTEQALAIALKTNPQVGTHPDAIIKVAKSYGLQVLHGVDGNLDHLDSLILDGYVVMLAISVDVPHFVVYLGSNGSHSFFHDPYFGEKLSREKKKWISDVQKYPFVRWRVVASEFKSHDFSGKGLESNKYWMAVKK